MRSFYAGRQDSGREELPFSQYAPSCKVVRTYRSLRNAEQGSWLKRITGGKSLSREEARNKLARSLERVLVDTADAMRNTTAIGQRVPMIGERASNLRSTLAVLLNLRSEIDSLRVAGQLLDDLREAMLSRVQYPPGAFRFDGGFVALSELLDFTGATNVLMVEIQKPGTEEDDDPKKRDTWHGGSLSR